MRPYAGEMLLRRQRDGEGEHGLDSGNNRGGFGGFFQPMGHVADGGSDRDGRDAHGYGDVGVGGASIFDDTRA